MFFETEETENHTQNSNYREKNDNLRVHPLAKRIGIACHHTLARFLIGCAHAFFQCSLWIVRLQEQGTQRRRKRQGVQSWETDGNRHGQTELLVERTCRTAHETYRDKHGHHHQRNGNDGTAQFAHGINGSLTGRLIPLVQLGMDTLDDDYGIVDDYGNRKHHCRQGQQVDTKAD